MLTILTLLVFFGRKGGTLFTFYPVLNLKGFRLSVFLLRYFETRSHHVDLGGLELAMQARLKSNLQRDPPVLSSWD